MNIINNCVNVSKNLNQTCILQSNSSIGTENVDVSEPYVSLITHQYIVLGWLTLIVNLFGIFGNMVAISVLTQPNMRNSTNIFLTGLAISDLIGLLVIFFLIPLRYILVSHGSFLFYEIHTRLFPYLFPIATTFQCCSIFLTVAACTSRTVTVYYTIDISKHSNITRPIKIICLIFLFSVLICIPFWLEYKTVQVKDAITNTTRVFITITTIGSNLQFRLYMHIFITTTIYLIPLILLSVMNYLLVVAVVTTRRRKLHLGLRERNEFYITFMLIMVVLFFLVCQMPNLVLHIIHAINFQKRKTNSFIYWHHWANFLLILNSSSNFAVYCFFGENFRSTIRRIFFPRQDNETIQMINDRQEQFKKKISNAFSKLESIAQIQRSHYDCMSHSGSISLKIFSNQKSYQSLDDN